MKKRWKVFWIVCIALAAAGLVMIAAGAALGGLARLRSMDELENLPDIIIDDNSYGSGYAPGEPDGNMITAYEGVNDISLDLSNLGVVIAPADSDSVVVDTSQLRSDIRDNLVISMDGGELEMENDDHPGFYRNSKDMGVLYIGIPKGANYNSFSADTGAGLLEMEGISAEEISLEVGAGQIVAKDFYTDVLEADCGAGQISLQGQVQRNADLNCDIGEVLFTLPGGMDVYNYELSCSAGELVVGDETYGGIHNQMSIDNGSSCLIEAECRIGRMEIMFE